MPLAVALVLLCVSNINAGNLSHAVTPENKNLQKCVSDIVQKYFYLYTKLTFVDLHRDGQDILKEITFVPIVSRTARFTMNIPNEGYLIMAEDTANFINDIPFLVKEASWNPRAKFLIITSNSENQDLRQIFDMLMKYHVLDVLVLNEDVDPDLYTYNPYENYGCGKRYDKIIEYGKCSTSRHKDLYPNKLVTGLRKCTLQIFCTHFPPYAINPAIGTDIKVGIEEFILNQMSALEHFNVNFSYNVPPETFSIILNDTTVIGPLQSLQSWEADALIGAMYLTHPREKLFTYVHAHLTYTDLLYLVKRSSVVPAWKNLYLEFHVVVWSVLVLSFLIYYLIFVILVKPKDKIRVLLNMFESLFFNGKAITGNGIKKFLWISWIIFAYLISAYYQSSLISLANNPSKDYQICSKEDLQTYRIKPCVSNATRSYLLTVQNLTLEKNQHRGCELTMESISTVSRSTDVYTVVMQLFYWYNMHNVIADDGTPLTYTFKESLGQVGFAIYFYKGFPLQKRLNYHALRLRENGLIPFFINSMQFQNKIKLKFSKKKQPLYPMPWYILVCGYLLSTCTFLLELVINKYSTKPVTLPILRRD